MSDDLLFFWIAVSILLALTVTMLVVPLIRYQRIHPKMGYLYNIDIYREQIAEIEYDLYQKLLKVEHAASRRTEIQRRMLRAADATGNTVRTESKVESQRSFFLPSMIIVLAIPVGTVGLYIDRGAPGLPDRPAAAEITTIAQKNAERLADELAQYMEKNTGKVEGWLLLARFQRQLGSYAAAARSFYMAIEHGVKDTDTLASYGEMLVAQKGGRVLSEACAAFRQAYHYAKVANDDPRAAFYLGLAAFQAGNPYCAIAIWRGLEEHALPEAPWLNMLRNHIAIAAEQAHLTPTAIAPIAPVSDSPLCGGCTTGSDVRSAEDIGLSQAEESPDGAGEEEKSL
ncbi:Cytochrome c heme lyase subunit CcmH [invertebrate metagenome]|uniref:Cytochrome c heme lyase subunit CcmH n=1 Tax=invertebrate metagenome TaxID=1711999 RepID=A0A484H5I9_9ZZZZ